MPKRGGWTAVTAEERELRASSRAAAGAVDGLAATVAMSGAMYVAARGGWLGEPPPATITQRALHAAGARRAAAEHTPLLAWMAHLAFGATSGALYATPRRPPRSIQRAGVEGAAFGVLLWVVSYAGWIPALSILPPPHRDRRGRPTSVVLSHVVYGAVLGVLRERRRLTAAASRGRAASPC